MALTLLQPFNLDPNGNYTFANANLTGNVNASYFIGNGSQLTGIAGGNVTTSATPPVSPNSGDFWIDSNTGTMYIYFNDGTSNQWAEMESLYAFSSVEPNTTISNGNSNVIVAANSNVTVSVSGNSNVTTFTGSNIFVTANIIPTANITYDLGTTSNRFKDLWLSNSTIYIGAASITTDGGNLVLTNPDGGQSVVSGNQTVSSNTLVESNSNLAVANTYIGLSVNSNANVLLVTASGANITGTANISGNANVGNIGATQVVASGNVSGLYFIGNGSQLTGIDATAINNGNSNVKVTANGNVTVSVAGTSNILVITDTGINTSGTMNASGNISASYFIGNGSQLTGIDATAIQNGTANVRTYNNGNVAISASGSANVLVISGTGANIVGTANVSGNANVGNLGATGIVATTISGSLTTASQPNITGLGTLSGLNATGNVVAGNVYANSGTVGASLIAGTLTTASQPNVTSVGTLGNLSITNNLTVGGNFTVTGNLVYANVSDLVVNDPLIYLASNNVGDTDDIGIVANWDDGVYQHGGMARDHTDGVWKFFSNVVAEPTTTIDWANAVYDPVKMGSLSVVANITSGNANLGNSVTANYFTGNFYGTANSATTATTAGTVTTAAQPNITSTGTLTSLGVSGNITAANITANTGIFSGNGSGLSQLAGANVSGQVGNSLVAGTVYTAAQPNITSVGTLTAISVTGNGTFGNILGPHANGNSNVNIPAANGNVNISVGGTANVLVVTGTGANIAGTMNVTGNLTAGNITTGNGSGGNVSGVNYLTANYVAGTLTTASQPNITGVGTITSGIWNNNIGSSATFAAGLSGANLASITAANISGTVASATAATNASALLQNTSTSTTVYPTFTTSSANGNSQAVFNTSISANLSNASITATTFVGALSGAATSATTAGTVTTAAQPNITSTGTLTSLTISGNLTVDTNTLFVDSANNSVGIATTTPSYTLHVVGNVYATGDVVSASDMTIKSDVVKIDNALEKLLQLSGYTFLRQGEDMRSAGVSAQDVQKVLPEAVRGIDGALSVAYGALSGLIIESIKDLKSELERIKGLLNVN